MIIISITYFLTDLYILWLKNRIDVQPERDLCQWHRIPKMWLSI